MTSARSHLHELADRQHGVVTAAQARAAGMPRGTIDDHHDTGSWRALLAGTYLVEPAVYAQRWSDLPFETRLSAAVLSTGQALSP